MLCLVRYEVLQLKIGIIANVCIATIYRKLKQQCCKRCVKDNQLVAVKAEFNL